MYKIRKIWITIVVGIFFMPIAVLAQPQDARVMDVGLGWAKNTVNTAVFRKNSLVSNDHVQFISYYDGNGFLTLGKRELDSESWTVKQTPYSGHAADAHNVISMMVDGDGYLHVAWDHHNGRLRYAKSIEPEGLQLGEEEIMVGSEESRVTYPEFFALPNGDLLFFYRDGGSGAGNLIINKYEFVQKKWTRLYTNLISGGTTECLLAGLCGSKRNDSCFLGMARITRCSEQPRYGVCLFQRRRTDVAKDGWYIV